MTPLSISRTILIWGSTFSVFLMLSLAACIIYGLMLPAGFEMHRAWSPWLPGFEWLTLGGILAGLLWCLIYGFWAAALLVPLRRLMGHWLGDAHD
ncbi:hypothetical protein [Erythrobacter sp. SD-21]|jgi:hypothetical protein|uniref:hypothetical protein n=1 Tax=Erythrobacter sp. SD-21 TaxID=161528 RepID=UPI000153FD55|nr:hypothetical protein [Erythrobacter sp. SD-21]EDL48190.1 hypothetical protein ED21_31604 [Erythrobacter sp. SD-21]MBU1253887.1 hypothetical protein [Alphaproteobacteria bacterium]MBU1606642.1 hypothetical protein [Alphaproteobacteria bacterium]